MLKHTINCALHAFHVLRMSIAWTDTEAATTVRATDTVFVTDARIAGCTNGARRN
jgi:hypothetical protein